MRFAAWAAGVLVAWQVAGKATRDALFLSGVTAAENGAGGRVARILVRTPRADLTVEDPTHSLPNQIKVWRTSGFEMGEPLAMVAAETGFADQSHLTRRFKRLAGVTPGAYRKNVQYRKHRRRNVRGMKTAALLALCAATLLDAQF